VPERIPLLVALVFVDVRVAKGTRTDLANGVMVLGWSATGARSRHSTVAVTSQARERLPLASGYLDTRAIRTRGFLGLSPVVPMVKPLSYC